MKEHSVICSVLVPLFVFLAAAVDPVWAYPAAVLTVSGTTALILSRR